MYSSQVYANKMWKQPQQEQRRQKGRGSPGEEKECEGWLEVGVWRGQGRDELKRDGRDGIEMGRDEPSK